MAEKTSLYEFHLQQNGKMVEFAGFWLPVQYPAGIVREHLAVRHQAGLFDVSHMGQFLVEGPEAADWLDELCTSRIATLAEGQMRYGCLCNEEGGTIDDLIVYRRDAQRFLCVVNGATHQKDWDWFVRHQKDGVRLRDVSQNISLIALQGPRAMDIVARLMDAQKLPQRSYRFCEDLRIAGRRCLISRNGYTGEDGVEIMMDNADAMTICSAVMDAGAPLGCQPCGLGARDTLRLEAGMPLYGQELDEQTTPLEAGLNFAVKLDKEFFIGRKAMMQKGLKKIRVGLKVRGRGIAREHYDIVCQDRRIGSVTSGTLTPYLNEAIAMGYVDVDHSTQGSEVQICHQRRQMTAVITDLPFYKRK